jgi:HK97 family phage major capsid protein
MSTSQVQKLRAEHKSIVAQMTHVADQIPRGQKMSGALLERWNSLDESQKLLQQEIRQRETIAKFKEEPRPAFRGVDSSPASETRAQELRRSKEYARDVEYWLRTGQVGAALGEMHCYTNPLSPRTDQTVHEEMLAGLEKRTYSGLGSSPSANGVTLAPIDFENKIIERMKGIGGLRAISQVVTTGNGQPLHYPFLDDTAQEGGWVAEGTGPVAQQNPTSVSESVLESYLASSKQILLSIQLFATRISISKTCCSKPSRSGCHASPKRPMRLPQLRGSPRD